MVGHQVISMHFSLLLCTTLRRTGISVSIVFLFSCFLVIVNHNLLAVEEVLIDFREIIGEHSGKNMADLVWQTIETYGLQRKVF